MGSVDMHKKFVILTSALILLLSSEINAQEEIIVKVEEGNFIIKNLSVARKIFDSSIKGKTIEVSVLEGQVINSTSKDWIKITFQVDLFDLSGGRIPAKTYAHSGDKVFFDISNIKKGEQKPISGVPLVNPDRPLYGLGNVAIGRFEVNLIEGEYPAKYNFVMIKPIESRELSFEDNSIKIQFSISKQRVAFVLLNKAGSPIKIDWNQVSYIDIFGKSHRVIHSGVKYVDKEKLQVPTIVPPTAWIEDILFPIDYMYLGESGKWFENPMFPEPPRAILFKGKTFSIYMPVETNGVFKNYLFSIKIEDI